MPLQRSMQKMNKFRMPTSLFIGEVEWDIRTDYRTIIDILTYMTDPEFTADERAYIALGIFYKNFKDMPKDLYEEAFYAMNDFIDAGVKPGEKKTHRLMDWEQDAGLIVPAVNKSLGYEIRAKDYLHWWTFLGGYMEAGNGVFSSVIRVRDKLAKKKKLEPDEKDFYRENKSLVDLERKLSPEEEKDKEALEKLLGE